MFLAQLWILIGLNLLCPPKHHVMSTDGSQYNSFMIYHPSTPQKILPRHCRWRKRSHSQILTPVSSQFAYFCVNIQAFHCSNDFILENRPTNKCATNVRICDKKIVLVWVWREIPPCNSQYEKSPPPFAQLCLLCGICVLSRRQLSGSACNRFILRATGETWQWIHTDWERPLVWMCVFRKGGGGPCR